MEMNELETLVVQQLKENHKLLLENNFLLRKIIEQNHLIFTATQENIRYYSRHWLWYESSEVKELREKLNSLLKQINEYKRDK